MDQIHRGSEGWVVLLPLSLSQQIFIVQQLGMLTCLPEPVETEVKVQLDHLFALMENMC